jgi:hypothetical protein
MNLKTISDEKLLIDTKHYAFEEKKNGTLVLQHIREIDARKLFASLGYSSLYDYCLRELSLSEGSAARRIQATRLIRDLPEYEKKLKDGSVHETNLGKAQVFFNREAKKKNRFYSKKEKLALLQAIEGKSSRKVDSFFVSISPESARQEFAKPINSEETEIRFTAGRALMEKLEKIKNLLGNKLSDQQYATLFEELADIALKKLEPKPPTLAVLKVSETRYISANVKQAVWHRDGGRCTFVDPKSKRRCDSQHALQYEHLTPFAKGGKSTVENLTLHCPAHNQLTAIRAYGLDKMREFWPK